MHQDTGTPQETEPDLPLSAECSYGGTGWPWPAAGTGALGAAYLGGMACEPPHRATEQTTHKLEDNYTKISQPGHPAKGLRTLREFDIQGQWDLITEFPQDWGNRLLEGMNKSLCLPGPRRKEK